MTLLTVLIRNFRHYLKNNEHFHISPFLLEITKNTKKHLKKYLVVF